MKLNLFIEKDKIVKIDFEKIKDKIIRFNNLLKKNYAWQNEDLLNYNLDNNTKQVSTKKEMIENIASLINDLNHNITLKEVQNIISKNNPQNNIENSVVNLYEGLTLFLKPNKIIHQNSVFMLYNIINNSAKNDFRINPFRQNNLIAKEKQVNFKITDYNKIPAFFDQFINFINDKTTDIAPWINMQIIHVHNLAISPFENKNILFSKVLAIWYLFVYGKKEDWNYFPIQSYLDVFQLNSKQYFQIVQDCLLVGDYTEFIDFTIENIFKYQKDKILITKINQFLHKTRKLYLAEYEKKFLFVIVYYQMNEFDWKLFKKITKWVSSKQYVIKNLTNLVRYSLLSARNLKNRKFFYQSCFLKNTIEKLKNEIDF